uniref:Lipoprotein n=1 Tax=Ignavibacterium album TaxID=591197 RepID=A0A832DNR6_9BACT
MLSDKTLKRIFIVVLLLFISCSDKSEKIPVLNYEDKKQMLEITKKFFDENTSHAFGGVFDESGKETIIAGIEKNDKSEWGIKFYQLLLNDNKLEVVFETNLLDGSFKESLVDKIKFPMRDYELIYYNSQGYFMGSGGGEVISYIIDFGKKEIYYAHLVADPVVPPSLFISKNTQDKYIREFFYTYFKKDYPKLRIVDEDITLD